jgi:hypothetical protein
MHSPILTLPWQTWTTRVIAVLYSGMGALLLIILPVALFTLLPEYRTTDLTISIIVTAIVAGMLIVCLGLGYGLWRQDRRAIWIVLIIHGMALLGSVSEVIQALTTRSPFAVAVNELRPADLLHLGFIAALGGPRFLAWRRERRELRYWNKS